MCMKEVKKGRKEDIGSEGREEVRKGSEDRKEGR